MAKISDLLKGLFFLLLILQLAPPILKNLKRQYFDILEHKTKVASLPIRGIVYNSTYYIKYLKKYFKNPEIKAILLNIECPGSAAGSAEAIANEIDILKKEYPKPIITLTENICTSGGFFIGATTDYIIAPPSAFVGSIGTQIPGQFKLKDFIEQFKIHYNVVKAGEYKTVTDPFSDTTPEQLKYLENLAQSSYQNFIEHVSRHRPKLALSQAPVWANGKIFTALQAKELGLVDELGSQTNAERKLKELGLIEGKIMWVKPPTKSGIFSLFGSDTNDDQDQGTEVQELISGALKLLAKYTLN